MSENIFLKPLEFYQRNVNPLAQYIEQSGFYLHKMTGDPLEHCQKFISNGIKSNRFPNITDPVVHHFERDDNKDRFKVESRLSNYIQNVTKNKEVLAPTFTTYLNTDQEQSLLVGFIDGNVKRRSVAKKEAFKAKAEGKKDLAVIKDNEQTNMKLYNNSMSGAFAAGGTVLQNPTAHSTLTTITRTISSLGNSSNEKIIAGNRHYRSLDVTLDNLICLASSVDREEVGKVLVKYNLHIPSVQDVVNCVQYSTDLYWKDDKAFIKITEFISRLDDIERTAIVYTSDLYHIRIHNEQFVRQFLTELCSKITSVRIEDPLAVLKSTDEQVINYAHQICLTETKGIGKDYAKLSPENLNTLAATGLNIVNTILKYKDFISGMFLGRTVPASSAYIPDMIRRSVVLSDTDSTMFSVDEWVTWYFGELKFTEDAYALAGSVMFIATQCIAHALAIFSANMGVERKKVFNAAMKPEFVFAAFAQTSVAKHYYTTIIVKEGNVYKEPEMEIKGVYLKNSAAPKRLIKASQDHMKEILENVLDGKKLSIVSEIKRIADIERSITSSLLNGDVEFYKQSKVKSAEAYARGAEESPYLYHMLWQQVFEPKYGAIDPPPYGVIKIPTTLENPTALKNWLASIEDKEFHDRMLNWLTKYNKKTLPTMYLFLGYIKSNGIPKEIKSIINVKKIVLDLTITDRMVIESLGYFPKSGMLLNEVGY